MNNFKLPLIKSVPSLKLLDVGNLVLSRVVFPEKYMTVTPAEFQYISTIIMVDHHLRFQQINKYSFQNDNFSELTIKESCRSAARTVK